VETAYVALGSNLGAREQHLFSALAALRATPGIRSVAVSHLYETRPVGPGPQGCYLNAVARLETTLAPRALLERLLAIERVEGRERGPQRDLPRSLDLDLLLYGDLCVDEPGLVVPHPRLHERAFVLEPLSELAPAARHPGLGARFDLLAAQVRNPSAVWLHGAFPDPK
jgi:2-amino-4-hydroxy-6-hydroxymethyldihydropteridine diphosphokinase